MHLLKSLFTLSLFTIFYLLFTIPAGAAGLAPTATPRPSLTPLPEENVICQPIYGGGEICVQEGKVLLDKKIQHPQSGAFVDNLVGANDPKFAQNSPINFQLTITNTGETVFPLVNIEDLLPVSIDPDSVSSPGILERNGNPIISFDTTDLNPGETRTFFISGKIVSADKLPSAIDCNQINEALAATSKDQISKDNVQFCVQRVAPEKLPVVTKGGLPVLPPKKVVTTPPTGPEMLSLIALIPAGLAGFALRRSAKGRQESLGK